MVRFRGWDERRYYGLDLLSDRLKSLFVAEFGVLAVGAVIGALTLFAGGGGTVQHPTTSAQATVRTKQILEQTAAALSPAPQLESDSTTFGNRPTQCVADIPNAQFMVNVSHAYWLRGITASQFADVGRQVQAYWQRRGYTVQEALGLGKGEPDIHGMTKDDYVIALEWIARGGLVIVANSPCVYPDRPTQQPCPNPVYAEEPGLQPGGLHLGPPGKRFALSCVLPATARRSRA